MLVLLFVGLAGAFATGTAILGWLAVPALGFAAGAARALAGDARRPGIAAIAAGAAALAWTALLTLQALRGPLWPLAERLAGVFRVPAGALLLTSVAFGALLAWSAATLGAALGRAIARRRSNA